MTLPPNISEPDTGPNNEPDQYTRNAPDWTNDNAPERVFFINFRFFRYGTKDKAHGAAVLLSLLLLMVIVIVAVTGAIWPSAWIEKVFAWLGGAFLFVAGVAVGRNAPDGKDKD